MVAAVRVRKGRDVVQNRPYYYDVANGRTAWCKEDLQVPGGRAEGGEAVEVIALPQMRALVSMFDEEDSGGGEGEGAEEREEKRGGGGDSGVCTYHGAAADVDLAVNGGAIRADRLRVFPSLRAQSDVNGTSGRYWAGNAEEDLILFTLAIYCEELARYPFSFRARIGLRRIVLCRNLYFVFRAGRSQKRNNILDFFASTLFVDVNRKLDATDMKKLEHRMRRVIHHEVWHAFDECFVRLRPSVGIDEEFCDNNPKDFVYGAEGNAEYMKDHNTSSGVDASAPSEHFLNLYSTSALKEDRAEVWSAVMTRPEVLRQSESLVAKALLLLERAKEVGEGNTEFVEELEEIEKKIVRQDEHDKN